MTKVLQKSPTEWWAYKALNSVISFFQFRLYGIQFGARLRASRVSLHNIGQIRIGSSTSLTSFPDGTGYPCSLRTYFPEVRIAIGSHCVVNGAVLHSNCSITLGDRVMLGPGVIRVDNDSHPPVISDERFTGRAPEAAILLKDGVWIGMRSTVMKGVTVGENTIVAAGSLVTRSLPANVLAAGSPAKAIRELPRDLAALAEIKASLNRR